MKLLVSRFYFICIASLLLQVYLPQANAYAQAPAIEWQKTYGGTGYDEAERVIRTNDSGYIIVGWTYSNDGDVVGQHAGGSGDCWITKIDAIGNILWSKTIGGTGYEDGLDIQQTSDGGYIVCGHSSSNDGDLKNKFYGSYDAMVIKLDALGNIQWIKNYGGSEYDVFISIEEVPDGGYIACGYTSSGNIDVLGFKGNQDAWIVRLDNSGNIVWQRCVGGEARDVAWSVKPTPDGGFIFTGNSESVNGDITNPKGNYDLIAGKLNGQGSLLWIKNYGGTQIEWGWDVICTKDGGYVIAGYSFSSDGDLSVHYGQNDIWILKLDVNGNILWQKVYGGYDYDDPNSIEQTTDGGFIIAARTKSISGDITFNNGGNDYWILKLDVNGNLQWQKSLGGSKQDIGHCVTATIDGGFMVLGTSYSNDGDVIINKGKSDIWLVKLGNCVLSTPPVPANINGNATPCAGTTAIYSVVPVQAASGYMWSVPAGWSVISGQGSAQVTILVGTAPGSISVLAYNTCKFSAQQTLTCTPINEQTPLITIKSDKGDSICNGTPVSFSAVAVNATTPTYQWKKNGIDVGANISSYSDNTLKNGDVISCTLTTNGTCSVNNKVISNAITITVTTSATPTVAISASANNICSGTAVTFTASNTNGGTSPVFSWFKNGVGLFVNSPTYRDNALNNGDVITCSLMSNLGCITAAVVTSAPITLSVASLVTPTISITSSTNTVCKNVPLTFTASSVNGGTNPIYQWEKNRSSVGTNSNSYSYDNFDNGDIITCTLTSDRNCLTAQQVTSNPIQLTIYPNPVVQLDKTGSLCAGSTNTLDAGNFTSYSWNTGSTNRAIEINNIGQYVVWVTDNNGCKGTDVTSVTSIFPTPEKFLPADTAICSYDNLLLKPTGKFNSYLWSNGSNNSTITITQPGQFWVKVTDTRGCTGTDTIIVNPKDCPAGFFMPTAFTPNNDGKNDLLKPIIMGKVKHYQFWIYNRWGQLMFYSADRSKGWDGTYKQLQQDGNAFVWLCTYQLEGDMMHNAKGSFVLIR